jgi:perosamine synthetase
MSKIPIAGPSITEKEIEYVTDAAQNAWYDGAYMYVDQFEEAFKKHTNSKYAVSLPSATSGLHLSLLALGVGEGDEVIVPEITWVASASPIKYVGAKPIFVDVEPDTWCMSISSFREAITPKTEAVIPVDLYGNMPKMAEIRKIAHQHGIDVIEDAAEALGAKYNRKPAGSFGDTGVYSFHGTKTVTTGEGGMLVTDRDDIYQRVNVLRNQGFHPDEEKMFWSREIGYKYKMSDLQAAIGLSQLERLDEIVEKQRTVYNWYRDFLGDIEQIKLNAEPDNVYNTYWMVTSLIDQSMNIEKEEVIAKLQQNDIDCRPFFYPLSSIGTFQNEEDTKRAIEENTTAYELSPYGINLPSASNLSREQVKKASETLISILDI